MFLYRYYWNHSKIKLKDNLDIKVKQTWLIVSHQYSRSPTDLRHLCCKATPHSIAFAVINHMWSYFNVVLLNLYYLLKSQYSNRWTTAVAFSPKKKFLCTTVRCISCQLFWFLCYNLTKIVYLLSLISLPVQALSLSQVPIKSHALIN